MDAKAPKSFLEEILQALIKMADILNLKSLSKRDRKDLFILLLSFIAIIGFYKLKIIGSLEARITSSFYIILLFFRGVQFSIKDKKE
ncbi:MAG TPA: hypothetical protein PLZ08_10320 [Bacillota bacterium]|nr:hypothetical protein [Bacillota bacterium]HOL10063.1 hypothetical protein [Bacillota bacterium]HPO98333.1 hypothetical protein [Bacillota bacterium]